jgi:hypothetical protein
MRKTLGSPITFKGKRSVRRLGRSYRTLDNINSEIRDFLKEILAPLLAERVLRELREKREEQVKNSK